MCCDFFFFFFFQAEDGIRDGRVTGVQTCALPILLNPPSCQRCAILAGRWYRWSQGFLRHPRCDCVNLPAERQAWAEAEEIGRASCRERVERSVGAVSLKKKRVEEGKRRRRKKDKT